MGKAGVEKQVRLPLSKAVEIAFKSLKMRWQRSVLTLATIALAIAFLAFIWLTRIAEPALSATAGHIPGSVAAGAGGMARTVWLLSLSMLVCLVGITNAMLMSVMERFREIGTMKCLGALDSFILELFFIESVFLGGSGAVIGALLGCMMGMLQLWRKFGSSVGGQISWSELLGVGGGAAAIGIVIAAAAAFYPALKAARMDPIAAMRVEV